MIEKDVLESIMNSYEKKMVSIGTIGSHSELNIFKGAIEEGLRTALRDANQKLHLGPGLDENSMECGPGI